MDWTEITLTVKTEDGETAAAIATVAAPQGIYIEDYADMDETLPRIGWVDAVDEELQARDRTRCVIRMYFPLLPGPAEALSYLRERLLAEGLQHTLECATVREEDWADNWKQYYKPERIGQSLVVCPSWETWDKKPDEVVIRLDPGSAFGTGQHETTRLCLTMLEKHLKKGDRLLDMGCGSGILSIAALALGAAEITAIDIDPNAANVAKENAALNGYLEERYRVFSGNVLENGALAEQLGNGYDMVAANIVADVIVPMRHILYERLRAGGILIASGVIDTRMDEVCAALVEAGFLPLEQVECNGWGALVVVRH